MKILDRKQFLALPSGVLYSKFQYCRIDGLYMKYETKGDVDWVYQTLIDTPLSFKDDYSDVYEIYEKSHKEGKSFEMDYENTARDGLYEEEQLFAVYEKDDVMKLIQFLGENVNTSISF